MVLTPNKFGKFYHFYNSHLLAGTTKNIFLVGNVIRLAHLSVIAKRYNSPHEVWPCLHSKYFDKLSHIYGLNIVRMHLQKIGSCSSWGVLRSHSLFARGSHCPFPLKILVSLIIFETLFYLAATIKNIFCVNYGVKLAHISVAPKFYNSLIPLNEVWPCLSLKIFW